MGIIDKAKRVAGKAWDSVQNLGDRFKNNISRVQGYVGTLFEVAKNGSTFIGLNYASEETIRASIRSYVAAVQTEVAKLNTDISNSNALKGQIAVATTEYVKAVSEVADAYVSGLLAYSDKMHEYAVRLRDNDENVLSQDIREEAKALSSEAASSRYTEKY